MLVRDSILRSVVVKLSRAEAPCGAAKTGVKIMTVRPTVVVKSRKPVTVFVVSLSLAASVSQVSETAAPDSVINVGVGKVGETVGKYTMPSKLGSCKAVADVSKVKNSQEPLMQRAVKLNSHACRKLEGLNQTTSNLACHGIKL